MRDRAKAGRQSPLLCILINQAAFPGLGSILMGLRVGWIQAACMVTGFVISMGFGLWYLWCSAQVLRHPSWTEADFVALYKPRLWALQWGLGLCALSWAWALVSSVGIWKGRELTTR